MKILFVRNGDSFPTLHAGTEKAMHALCTRLARDGHLVAFAAVGDELPGHDTDSFGYRTFRSGDIRESVDRAATAIAPEVLVVMEVGEWLQSLPLDLDRLAVVCYQHNIHPWLKVLPESYKRKFTFIANSVFTRSVMGILGIRSAVVPPIFGIDHYRGVEPVDREFAVFVSLQERKGFDVCCHLARSRPERKFLFIKSWGTTAEAVAEAEQLPNVQLLENQPDLQQVFRKSRLLLMPSRSTETWGLSASEAQVCGIPVLASNGGNLANTVGQGGLIVPLSLDTDYWLAAFDTFYDDERYAELCRRAAARGEELLAGIDRCYQAFIQILNNALGDRGG